MAASASGFLSGCCTCIGAGGCGSICLGARAAVVRWKQCADHARLHLQLYLRHSKSG